MLFLVVFYMVTAAIECRFIHFFIFLLTFLLNFCGPEFNLTRNNSPSKLSER